MNCGFMSTDLSRAESADRRRIVRDFLFACKPLGSHARRFTLFYSPGQVHIQGSVECEQLWRSRYDVW